MALLQINSSTYNHGNHTGHPNDWFQPQKYPAKWKSWKMEAIFDNICGHRTRNSDKSWKSWKILIIHWIRNYQCQKSSTEIFHQNNRDKSWNSDAFGGGSEPTLESVGVQEFMDKALLADTYAAVHWNSHKNSHKSWKFPINCWEEFLQL